MTIANTETAIEGEFVSAPASGAIENPDPLFTAREGCAFLGISEPTFWRHVAEGKLPKPIKLGRLSRWPKSELLAVIERAKVARNV